MDKMKAFEIAKFPKYFTEMQLPLKYFLKLCTN